jgi:hypothetical protein
MYNTSDPVPESTGLRRMKRRLGMNIDPKNTILSKAKAMTELKMLNEKLDHLIQFERGDVFYRRLHPDVISQYFPMSHGSVAPRKSVEASDFAKLLGSTRSRIKPSTTLAEYNMWKNEVAQKATIQYPGRPPAIRAA